MALQLKVPSMTCEGCVDTVTKAIKTVDGGAKVDIDLETKDVSVETEASRASIRDAIVAQGHTVD